jgi:thioredoxin 1
MTEDQELEEIRRQKMEQLRAGETAGDTAQTKATPDEPFPIDGQADLDATVEEYELVLADFHADWCGPCQMIEPIVEEIAADMDVAVAKVDIDVHQQLAAEYGVRGVPTLVLFADGNAAERLVGMQDEGTLRSTIQSYA